jgi:hypothetical protein
VSSPSFKSCLPSSELVWIGLPKTALSARAAGLEAADESASKLSSLPKPNSITPNRSPAAGTKMLVAIITLPKKSSFCASREFRFYLYVLCVDIIDRYRSRPDPEMAVLTTSSTDRSTLAITHSDSVITKQISVAPLKAFASGSVNGWHHAEANRKARHMMMPTTSCSIDPLDTNMSRPVKVTLRSISSVSAVQHCTAHN